MSAAPEKKAAPATKPKKAKETPAPAVAAPSAVDEAAAKPKATKTAKTGKEILAKSKVFIGDKDISEADAKHILAFLEKYL